MALVAQVDGKITIGDSGEIQQAATFSNASATITDHNSGKMLVAASTTVDIPLGGVTNPSSLYIKAANDADDSAVYVDVLYANGGATTSVALRISEALLTLNSSGDENMTAISVLTKAGITTKVEYIVGGI